jgi:monoterpene epsilon-lactone hydrolase
MPSIRSYLWRSLLSRAFDWTLPLETLRRTIDANASWMKPPKDVAIVPLPSGPVRGEWLIPEGASARDCILWLHGGGYALGSMASHRAMVARIAKAARTKALLLDYRLAPEFPFPAALDDALAAHRWLPRQGIDARRIVLGGDSAGGGLALAMMVALRDADEALPRLFVGLSPWTDLTCSGESIRSNSDVDPYLTRESLEFRKLYAAPGAFTNPFVSPLFANLRGLPPMLMHAGTDEILLSDTTRLAKKARASGVDVRLRIWPRMWHIFHAFAPYLPEANAAIREIGGAVQAWENKRLEHPTPIRFRRALLQPGR